MSCLWMCVFTFELESPIFVFIYPRRQNDKSGFLLETESCEVASQRLGKDFFLSFGRE